MITLSPRSRARRARTNPYVVKIDEFPDSILSFEDAERDREIVVERIKKAQQVICEIGSGSGGHLNELASRHPQSAAFGFELRFKRAFRTIEKAHHRGVSNVTVLKTDAFMLGEIFPAESIDLLVINFPDPWEKRRTHKHRLLSERLFRLIKPKLQRGALVSIKTDHVENFRNAHAILANDKDFVLQLATEDLHNTPAREQNIETEFEKMFLKQGKPICKIEALFQCKGGC